MPPKLRFRFCPILLCVMLLAFSSDIHAEKKKPLNPLRAHLLGLGTYLASTINYWGEGAKWSEDIDFRLTFADQTKRLFSLDSYRFDSNRFKTNWQHAFSGAAYYNIYRTNGYSLLKSLEYSTYLSLLWEYISEYQEVISYNDLLYNSVGAISAGENLFQISAYCHQQQSIGLKLLGYVLNPINALNRLLDGRKPLQLPIYAQERKHAGSLRFALSKGDLSPQTGEQTFFTTKLTFDLFPSRHKKTLEPARLNWQNNFLFGHFSFSLTGSKSGLDEFRLLMRNTLLGWSKESWTVSGSHSLLAIGFGNNLDLYRKKAVDPFDTNAAQLSWEPDRVIDHPVEYTDKISSLGLLGTSLLLRFSQNRFHLNLETGLSFNFALINSLPFNALSHEKIIQDTKATLLYYGYYYGIGFCGYFKTDLAWDPLLFSITYDIQAYNSIEGIDRFQKTMTWDPHLADSRSFMEMGLFIKPCRPFRLGIVYEHLGRRGTIESFRQHESEKRMSLMLAYLF